MMIPRPSMLDGGIAFLPQPEEPGVGALTYLPAPNLTILAWWESAFDGRPGCNMALIGNGYGTAASLWNQFAAAAPDVVAHLTMPQVVKAQIEPTPSPERKTS